MWEGNRKKGNKTDRERKHLGSRGEEARERETDRVSGKMWEREGERGGEDGGMEVAQGAEEGDLTQIGSLTAAAAAE